MYIVQNPDLIYWMNGSNGLIVLSGKSTCIMNRENKLVPVIIADNKGYKQTISCFVVLTSNTIQIGSQLI